MHKDERGAITADAYYKVTSGYGRGEVEKRTEQHKSKQCKRGEQKDQIDGRRSVLADDSRLLRTALDLTTSIDRDAVKRGLGPVSGLACAERQRVEVVIRFLLLTVTISLGPVKGIQK